MPAPVYTLIRCYPCGQSYAAMRDPNTMNVWYFSYPGLPEWPPVAVAAGLPKDACPKCAEKATVVSGAAVVSASGKWLRLDQRAVKLRGDGQ